MFHCHYRLQFCSKVLKQEDHYKQYTNRKPMQFNKQTECRSSLLLRNQNHRHIQFAKIVSLNARKTVSNLDKAQDIIIKRTMNVTPAEDKIQVCRRKWLNSFLRMRVRNIFLNKCHTSFLTGRRLKKCWRNDQVTDLTSNDTGCKIYSDSDDDIMFNR